MTPEPPVLHQVFGWLLIGLVFGVFGLLRLAVDMHRAGLLPVVRRRRLRDRLWNNDKGDAMKTPPADPETCDDCGEWVIEGPLCLACVDDRLADAADERALEASRDAR